MLRCKEVAESPFSRKAPEKGNVEGEAMLDNKEKVLETGLEEG